MYARKSKVKRITLNLPAELLEEAQAATGQNMTDTIISGLESLKRANASKKASRLKGNLRLNVDLKVSRERDR